MTDKILYFQTQTRFHRDSEGRLRSPASYARYAAWQPYLQGFDKVRLLGRVSPQISDAGYEVEGPGVTVEPLPYFEGPVGLLKALPSLFTFVRELPGDSTTCYGGRVADPIASLLARKARKSGRHFIAQVVGDPAEAMAAGSFGKFLGVLHPVVRTWVRHQVASASAVIYVTRETLQKEYPANDHAITVARSNVELPSESFVAAPRDYSLKRIRTPMRLITVGGHSQKFKGHDLLLQAVSSLKQEGLSVTLDILGGGRYHEFYKQIAEDLAISDIVNFHGHVTDPGSVRTALREADLFILPSLTEGLPRALIEAMAQGIACVASNVGGNSELLPEDAIFKSRSTEAIATIVRSCTKDQKRLTTWATLGHARAKEIAETQSGPRVLATFVKALTTARVPSTEGVR